MRVPRRVPKPSRDRHSALLAPRRDTDVPTGFLLQPTYRVRDGVPVVQLYGRLDDGRPFQIEDDRFRPYFFVRAADAELLRGDPRAVFAPSELRSFSGDALVRVAAPVPAAVPPMRDR